MLEVKVHGPVRELVLSTLLGRALGLKVSAFLRRGSSLPARDAAEPGG